VLSPTRMPEPSTRVLRLSAYHPHMQGGNYHLILVLLFFAFSAVSWVVGKLREQAAIKKARDEMKRARDEELRTGRAVAQPAPTRGGELAELRELAMKRQQQLQQMRDMQKRAPQTTRGGTPEILVGAPLPVPGLPNRPGTLSAPGMPRTPGTPGIPGRPRPIPPQTVRPVPLPNRGVQDIRPGTPTPRQQKKPPMSRRDAAEADFRPPYTVEPATPRRLVADSHEPHHAITEAGATRRAAPIGLSALLGTAGTRPTTSDMRRAIILSEIFSKPVGARPPSER
jgi:hypothetical protein